MKFKHDIKLFFVTNIVSEKIIKFIFSKNVNFLYEKKKFLYLYKTYK